MTRRLSLALILLACTATAGWAQQQQPKEAKFPLYLDTGTGDLKFRSHTYMSIPGPDNKQVLFVSGEGLTGEIFQTRADGSPGWQDMANAMNWNTYSLTLVGCGKTDPVPSRDLVTLTEKAAYGVAQMGLGSRSQLVITSGLSAAMAIHARALYKDAFSTAVLIDPWGPPGVTSRPTPSIEEVISWRDRKEEILFARWGLGPSYGEFSEDSDLGPDGFAAMVERVEDDQPPYWAAVATGFDGGLWVQEPRSLADWPVLLVQGPHLTDDEILWQDEVANWLIYHGARVERMKLTDLGLPGISSLPMAGRHAEPVLRHFLEWSLAQPLVEAEETGR